MLSTIIEASQNFCTHQVREECTIKNGILQMRTLIAYIDINTQDTKEYRVYIASDKGFMQKVSHIFLEEDESDEETLIDMTLETANLIIGSAKVIAESSNNPYLIKTPHFEKFDSFDFDYDQAKIVQLKDSAIMIAIKELNVQK